MDSDKASNCVAFVLRVLLVMVLWNWLLPSIFHVRSINALEALGIIVFTNCIFYKKPVQKVLVLNK